MKLSAKSKKIFDNFATINPGIVIKASQDETGTTIQTVNHSKGLIAIAHIEEVFNHPVALHQLGAFLKTLSAFKDPDIELFSTHLTIKENGSTANISYSDPAFIITNDKTPKSDIEFDVEFELKDEVLQKVMNLGSILNLPHLRIYTKEGKLFLQAVDSSNVNSSVYEEEIGTISEDVNINKFISRDLIKFVPGDYQVSMKSFARFKNLVDENLIYFVGFAKQ